MPSTRAWSWINRWREIIQLLTLWYSSGGLPVYSQRICSEQRERSLYRAAAAGVDSLRFCFGFVVSDAWAQCGDGLHLISQLNRWQPHSLRDADSLLQAAEVALEAGADSVGAYRADTVETLELWPAEPQIFKMV